MSEAVEPDAKYVPEPFDHVMIDIETLSLHKHKALILSIGMVEFDPTPLERPRIGARSLIVLDPLEQLILGRHVSQSTQAWWADPARERARWHWANPQAARVNAGLALAHVRTFCAGKSSVWANGNQFDLANLEGLAEDVKVEELWHYRAPADMRSFVKHTPQTRIMNIGEAIDMSEGEAHDPVWDCLVQIHQVWQHWA